MRFFYLYQVVMITDGHQLTVRESQVGVFFYKGKAVEAFGPGRHTLKTGNIPILTKILSIPWGLSSPCGLKCTLQT